MSKTSAWENDLLLLLGNNVTSALIGDATGLRGSTAAGQLFLSLHTADPGEAGTQTTSEAAYTSYARVGVNRASGAGGFSITGNAMALVSKMSFPAGTGGSGTATHWGLGTSASGAGKLLYKGALTPNIVMGNGITPEINAGTIVTES
jgi:hypothetical protein